MTSSFFLPDGAQGDPPPVGAFTGAPPRSRTRYEELMRYTLSEKEIAAIEKVLNKAGATEAVVKVERGQIVVLLAEKKKVALG